MVPWRGPAPLPTLSSLLASSQLFTRCVLCVVSLGATRLFLLIALTVHPVMASELPLCRAPLFPGPPTLRVL